MWPPARDDLFNYAAVGVWVDHILLTSDVGEDRHHVFANVAIHIGKIGEIEAAISFSVPPGEQKVGDAPALAIVAVGNVEQLFEGERTPSSMEKGLCGAWFDPDSVDSRALSIYHR